MTVLHVLAYVMLQLDIPKRIDSLGYDFPVYPTEICPMTAKEWSNAAIQLDCNETHGYHCVPDKNFSSLIQFCYPRGRNIPFQKGNCLELAYTGILNHVKCGHFIYGCPEKDYFSNEIYRYPACLRLVAKCFAADLNCLRKRFTMIDGREKNSTYNREQSLEEENNATGFIVAVFSLSILLLILCGLVAILCLNIRKLQRERSIDSALKE
ncbi:uncharacterized protein LOC134266712, partial [Saccostrea cucullata]|uniref:uncharacterized protein LOC134266712 n=1 Tax=Saccostrea cuccullata TaxID=36930 RepID=UPI002ED344A4